MPRLRILFAVPECVPFAKTGGLGDVASALPRALARRGHDVRIVLPRYRSATRFAAERHPAPLSVPVGYGDAHCAVWETRIPEAHGAPSGGTPRVYLLEQNEMFDRAGVYGDAHGSFGDNLARYTFLSRGALALCRALDWIPDVAHVHDWPTALLPVSLNTTDAHGPLGGIATVLTIHNLGYQGIFPASERYLTGLDAHAAGVSGMEAFGHLNLLRAGLHSATMVSTVSPRYAMEIQTPEGGDGLDAVVRSRGTDVVGILNGIDDTIWNPDVDPYISAPFAPHDLSGKSVCKAALQREVGLPEQENAPLFGVISRFAHQKGIDILAGALDRILALDAQIVVLGSGEPWAEALFSRLSAETDRFRTYIGMNEALAHRIEAGADFFLMPSRYEPCGLNQMYSQRYGTLPVVRAVGGLDDTVEHNATGFKFVELSSDALFATVQWAVGVYKNRPDLYRAMQFHAMNKEMGWGHAARQYEALYRLAVAKRRGRIY